MTCFGSTRSQVRILSPRLVTVRVLGETGNPCFLTCKRKCKRNSPVTGLSRVLGRPAAPVGGRWARKPVIDLPEAARDFLLHLLQLVAQEEGASSAEGRRPPGGGDAGCHAAQGRGFPLARLRGHRGGHGHDWKDQLRAAAIRIASRGVSRWTECNL